MKENIKNVVGQAGLVKGVLGSKAESNVLKRGRKLFIIMVYRAYLVARIDCMLFLFENEKSLRHKRTNVRCTDSKCTK